MKHTGCLTRQMKDIEIGKCLMSRETRLSLYWEASHAAGGGGLYRICRDE